MDMQKETAIRRWNNLAIAAVEDEAAFDELYGRFSLLSTMSSMRG